VISTGVDLRQFIVLATVFVASCATSIHDSPASKPSTPVTAGQAVHVNPANIRRMRGSFPPGYEVTEIQGVTSPAKYWGLRPGWTSDPTRCTALADPANGAPTQGLSGSGSGEIIYVVVAPVTPAGGPDPGVVAECRHWSMDSGRTTAISNLIDAPVIQDVPTVAMVTTIRTTVEGGNETDLHATTATAYLGDYAAFVTVVTDPGLTPSALPTDFASTFLTQAVATLRG
jgi:hypothetical protein